MTHIYLTDIFMFMNRISNEMSHSYLNAKQPRQNIIFFFVLACIEFILEIFLLLSDENRSDKKRSARNLLFFLLQKFELHNSYAINDNDHYNMSLTQKSSQKQPGTKWLYQFEVIKLFAVRTKSFFSFSLVASFIE